ncbi:MAG: hypothetical protein NXH88_13850 [Hyphomonas sp.]|nr:hypothetical protein [Hyphomonas sp.]
MASPRLAIVVYSLTGNNLVLAQHLGGRLGADVLEVRDVRRRTQWSVALDLMFKRQAAIRPLDLDPASYDEILFMAPLWDMHVAMPMAAAMRALKGNIIRYGFVSLCGYDRPGQQAHVEAELTDLLGVRPVHVSQLFVGTLYPPQDRNKVWLISSRRIRAGELGRFSREIEAIAGWFSAPADRQGSTPTA